MVGGEKNLCSKFNGCSNVSDFELLCLKTLPQLSRPPLSVQTPEIYRSGKMFKLDIFTAGTLSNIF